MRPRYKPDHLKQDAFVPVCFDKQILPGKGVIWGYVAVALTDARHQIIVEAQAHDVPQEEELLPPVFEGVQESFTHSARMREKIDSPRGRMIYSQRLGTVEPPFGNIRSTMGMKRFTLRGGRRWTDNGSCTHWCTTSRSWRIMAEADDEARNQPDNRSTASAKMVSRTGKAPRDR